MKLYNIYRHPNRDVEAVKQGWSWPAFLFGAIWALIKRIWWLAGAIVGIAIGLGFLMGIMAAFIPTMNGSILLDIFNILFGLGLFIWLGLTGNKFREENLYSRGFDLVAKNISAPNPNKAVALYFQQRQGNRENPSRSTQKRSELEL